MLKGTTATKAYGEVGVEKLFSLEYGISGVCVLLTVMVLLRVAEFLWQLHEKKESLSDSAIVELTKAIQENTIAVKLLETRLVSVEGAITEFPKLKLDVRRFFSAIKELAGDKWPDIRDEILKDGFTV